MYKTLVLSLLILVSAINTFGQKASYSTHKFSVPLSSAINISSIKDDWQPQLQNLEMPYPGSNAAHLLQLKEDMRKKYPLKELGNYKNQNAHFTGTEPAPVVQRNFEANTQGSGVPLDNDVAISNGGKLVSVSNNIVYIFNVETGTLLQTKSLSALAQPLGLSVIASKYDPKVLYDPIADRFILIFLTGTSHTYTKIVLAFSQTNDPTAGWNLYTLSGNPLNNNLWSDYPMLAITKEDLFITINLLVDGGSWQTSFVETVIWQIGKHSCYSGFTLNPTLYSGITYNGKSVRNLCPIKGGAEILGPNMYFLSNKNLAIQNDTLFLVEVSNSLSNGNAQLSVKQTFSPFDYFLAPNARQANSVFLQTNDSRILGGFLFNNKIQFVQNTMDTATGFAAVYHGIMENLSSDKPTVTAKIISDPVLDFGYPNISYSGSNINYSGLNEGENESIISFNHTSPADSAGISAVYYSNKKGYSPIITVKKGIDYIDQLSGVNERWGDYSGSQRKYNESGKVWITATFGKPNKKYGTWAAELGSPDSVRKIPSQGEYIIYPVPTKDNISVNFNVNAVEVFSFNIYDMQGKLVIKLMEDFVKTGQNIFTFSAQPLNKGVYVLVIESERTATFKQKFVKQ